MLPRFSFKAGLVLVDVVISAGSLQLSAPSMTALVANQGDSPDEMTDGNRRKKAWSFQANMRQL